jgi:hypothetical protein
LSASIGNTVNAAYIVKVLGIFVNLLKQKRARSETMVSALGQCPAAHRQYLVKKSIQVLPRTLFSADLAIDISWVDYHNTASTCEVILSTAPQFILLW